MTAPTVVRVLSTPAAGALADLASIFDELQAVLGCCERLIGAPPPDEVTREALWTSAVLSYGRCFAPGPRGMGLTAADVTAAGLTGAVGEWHEMLLRLPAHYADPVVNPRERFSVGVSRDAAGAVAGVAVTSVRQPLVDTTTVRQTGALAYALMQLVDGRIGEQQARVSAAAGGLSAAALDALQEVQVS